MGVLRLASAERENASQATMWATAAFATSLVGAAAAVVGAFLRDR